MGYEVCPETVVLGCRWPKRTDAALLGWTTLGPEHRVPRAGDQSGYEQGRLHDPYPDGSVYQTQFLQTRRWYLSSILRGRSAAGREGTRSALAIYCSMVAPCSLTGQHVREWPLCRSITLSIMLCRMRGLYEAGLKIECAQSCENRRDRLNASLEGRIRTSRLTIARKYSDDVPWLARYVESNRRSGMRASSAGSALQPQLLQYLSGGRSHERWLGANGMHRRSTARALCAAELPPQVMVVARRETSAVRSRSLEGSVRAKRARPAAAAGRGSRRKR